MTDAMNSAAPPATATATARSRRGRPGAGEPQARRRLPAPIKVLSSLRLTVWLLAMFMFLVFAGTWAQIDMGIWSTLKTYFRSFLVVIPFQVFLPRAWSVPGGIPFPGGYLLGGLLTVNLLAAHATRFRFARRRSGILLIHVGLILLIAGELITALYAVESNMTINEGETVNFTEDTREVELAIIDTSDPEEDRVVAVPESILKRGGLIQHALLPFEIHVDDYYPNADLLGPDEVPAGTALRADRGTAFTRKLSAVERPVASGVGQDTIDIPTAFLTLRAGGRSLGTWMTSLYFYLSRDLPMPLDEPQEVDVDGRKYEILLRYKRTYKPYSLQLVDFRHDRYVGTDTPKNFSSLVRLIDPRFNEDREVLIYMNHPLRHAGETFYQASFKRGDTATILQVVRNPGWLMPYVACTLGALGMLIHFGMLLTRFLTRRRA